MATKVPHPPGKVPSRSLQETADRFSPYHRFEETGSSQSPPHCQPRQVSKVCHLSPG